MEISLFLVWLFIKHYFYICTQSDNTPNLNQPSHTLEISHTSSPNKVRKFLFFIRVTPNSFLSNLALGSTNGPKMVHNWWNYHIIQTKWVRMVIFVPTTPFSYQGSLFITFSDTSNNRIPTILAPRVPKWLQKWSKMGEMAILSKLDELGCWFWFLLPHFHTRGVCL